MNSLQLRTTLYSATASTFEALALLCPSAEISKEQRLVPLAGSARVTFDGPLRGMILLGVTADVLGAAATNMLGRDDAPVASMQRDAICELANVICGSLLPQIGGSRALFRLGVPTWVDGDGARLLAESTPMSETRVGLDEGRADVALYIANARLATEPAGS
ncbi:MAG: chemotaxis protein CheX [Gemmatimonadaceae bacterium]